MWNASNQRVKALQAARQREYDRRSRPILVRRVTLEIKSGGETVATGRILLNDLNTHYLTLFSDKTLSPNLPIELIITDPKEFQIKGRVSWCQYQPSTASIIQTEKFPYRMGIRLSVLSTEVKVEFEKFCTLLKEGYTNPQTLLQLENQEMAAEVGATTTANAGTTPGAQTAAPAAETAPVASITPAATETPTAADAPATEQKAA